MTQFGKILQIVLIMLPVVSCSAQKKSDVKSIAQSSAYTADFESLAKHSDAPEWFRDAKLGIYFHWGVYSVPAFGSEWYPRNMHDKKRADYKHHVKTWGDPTEFGYADFVPMFKAEHFDADEWAKLFKKAGARFAGPVSEHHDGFSLWDSKVTPWNSVDMGPKQDITGELEKAIRKQDMRFITTFHHARNSLWESEPGKWTGHYDRIKRNFPSLLEDTQRAILYGYVPRDQFVNMWKGKLIEVIDNYHPDIIWFDSWLHQIPEKDRFEFSAYYFNQARKKAQEVVIIRKQNDLPLEFSVNDHEKSRESKGSDRVWMTDDTISTGSWCYTNNLKIKPTKDVVHALIDTVSKNGIVLLNISPMADGTMPEDQRNVLLELGQWMRVNGEGIYSTRPWITYGEGPTKEPEGGFKERKKFLNLQYSAADIRYTQSKDGDTFYAITMGWPETSFTLKSLSVPSDGGKFKIKLLGSRAKVGYTINEDKTLTIHPPTLEKTQRPCQFACVFKIEGLNLTSIQ